MSIINDISDALQRGKKKEVTKAGTAGYRRRY